MLESYLEHLGLSEKEQKIYLALLELGVQPASVVAKHCRLDRVTTYKHMKRLCAQGLLKTYYTHAIQHFGVEGPEVIERLLKEREQHVRGLIENYPEAAKELRNKTQGQQQIPSVQVFEGENGIKSCMQDLLFELKTQQIRQVRLLSTNTFSERLGNVSLSRFLGSFLTSIKRDGIDLDILEATGTLLPERLEHRTIEEMDLKHLPAANGATHIFLAGSAVYLLTFKQTQTGLKIKQQEMAQIFHFLFDAVRKG